MPLHVASYFAGVGTVLATMTLGFGAGVMMTDAFLGKRDDPPNLLERRASPASEPVAPVAAPMAETTSSQQSATQSSATPSPDLQSAIVAQQAAPPHEVQTTPPEPVAPIQTGEHTSLNVQQRQHEDAMARAREIELKKSQIAERRKERRRKWAERRKREQRRIQELDAVAERVRAAERQPAGRSFSAEPPTIHLFEDE